MRCQRRPCVELDSRRRQKQSLHACSRSAVPMWRKKHKMCVQCDVNVLYNLFKGYPLHNQCKCQYWPVVDIGAIHPAFCTGYYTSGDSKVHHWICCDNCLDQLGANSCDKKTWQGGSTYDYCGECGKNLGHGHEKYYFDCGSCEDQQHCESRCSRPFWMKLPGFCWLWADCFKDCCLKLQQPRQYF